MTLIRRNLRPFTPRGLILLPYQPLSPLKLVPLGPLIHTLYIPRSLLFDQRYPSIHMPQTASTTHLPPSHSVQCTVRDLRILLELFESRIITIHQAAALFFRSSSRTSQTAYAKAARRLAKLTRAGLLRRRQVASTAPQGPIVYLLAKKGFDQLRRDRRITGYTDAYWEQRLRRRLEVSSSTLNHDIAVMDVKASLQPALQALSHASVTEFNTWPDRYAFSVQLPDTLRSRKISQKPDAFLRYLRQPTGHHDFFIEVDRGTESLTRIKTTALAYRAYYTSGGFLRNHGRKGSRLQDFPFRVLFVCLNETRRNNLCESMLFLQPRPISTQTWFATLHELLADPLGPIWIFPKVYAKALRATSYHPSGHIRPHSNVRNQFIARRVLRYSLLDDPGADPSSVQEKANLID